MRPLMLNLLLLLLSIVSANSSSAASYQQIDGSVVPTIQYGPSNIPGGDHPYAGPDLAPGATLVGAPLSEADLAHANLSDANLSSAQLVETILTGANLRRSDMTEASLDITFLSGADLREANLTNVDLLYTRLAGADLRGANLTDSAYLGLVVGQPYYDATTNFTRAWSDSGTTPFDPIAAGWIFLPEPSAALLLGFGLFVLGSRERR